MTLWMGVSSSAAKLEAEAIKVARGNLFKQKLVHATALAPEADIARRVGR